MHPTTSIRSESERELLDLHFHRRPIPEFQGMGTANSSSQSSAGNGNEMGVLGGIFGLGGSFGLPLGVTLGWGVLLFISVFKKVSIGPWANSSSSSAPAAVPPAPGNDMTRTRLVARRTSGPRALTRIFLVAGGISGEASKTCCLAANRMGEPRILHQRAFVLFHQSLHVRRGHQVLFLVRPVTHPDRQ